jgi:oligopeptidase B
MLSYSPYDNIRPAEYPHMLITTGLNDPRVAYWEPAKFAAKLREVKTDNNLLLLQTNYSSGHAGSSGRYDSLKEAAVDYAFLIDRLCGHIPPAVQSQGILTPLELHEATSIIRQDLSVIE